MLDADTKRRIDTARDILVGKVPDPKSQIEQITIALIYKFMDDMDADSEEMGGERRFFTGEFAQYGWAKLMRSGLGGHETLNLYAGAIQRMPENPNIPTLFREIFKNAYLPYRDPETLRLFLKTIDEFTYDHSERLGDAFEYLLSVMGSQGDAGQFRTPRHIIDFIVAIIDPQKGEKILDPACGTAGFLISAYKHILAANEDADGNSTLTPDDRAALARNVMGYDISPDMVRLSLVNLYLHGFTDPHIHEYDTLTSEERWGEYADVILANPPFMSPKGGIIPHKRFTVTSKRSEVLFVDYMAEHLTAQGRAGIIVPEGIIFQSQTAYKQLRKLLVEESLAAVISLPAGVFNPYSGVKTSILVLDKGLAKQAGTIAFFKVENDGFGLGAQRREIAKNDLPQVQAEIAAYLAALRCGEPVDGLALTTGQVVAKEKIAANGEYNLSGERFMARSSRASSFPWVRLGDLIELDFGSRITKKNDEGSLYPVYGGGGESFRTNQFNREDDIVISRFAMSSECVRVVSGRFYLLDSGFTFSVSPSFCDHVLKPFVDLVLLNMQDRIYACARGHAQKNIDISAFKAIELPLPPLDVQQEIVAEIEGYQRVIDGARAVVENYRPQIVVDPEWPICALASLCTLISGQHIDKDDYNANHIGVDYLTGPSDFGHKYPIATRWTTKPKVFAQKGDILVTVKGSGLGSINMLNIERAAISRQLMAIRVQNADPSFVYVSLLAKYEHLQSLGGGAAIPGITREHVLSLEIPLPSLEEQHQIVAEIEVEQAVIDANRQLILRFEQKIQATLSRIWGEAPASTNAAAMEDTAQLVTA